ncbi:putative disease resistance protein RGA3 [Morus notabilis]|uniref:putative disease resistance protein RGA3 n=1 Tax=Morus notabilis TaxID=981085 RepID=UPI000CED3285|nr:putative disease resistance protein RGA3 [Morus notabilis]
MTHYTPIADKIVGGLGSAAVKEIALLWGVNDDLDQLNDTISTIKYVLLDAEEKQINSHQVRNWLRRLGGVVDDADNLLDEFNTEALRRRVMPAGSEMVKQVCTFFSASNQLAFRHKMGCRIREIRKKLDTISNDRNFRLEVRHEDNQAVSARRRRETYLFVRQEEVIGRDEDRVEIIKLLLEQGELEENVSVIPIVGMGGLGKTALAQTAFNEETVQQHFEPKMWVCVSDDFDLKLILQQIIKSATKNNNNLKDNDSMDQLQNELRNVLNGKRYLLVLDYVWEEKREEWSTLKDLLLSGSRGSRIVVTSRSKKVTATTGSVQPYQLGILDEEKSWSLFEKMAFKQKEEERDPEIVDIGRQIVKRLFPKDYRIEVETLVKLWMAQGLLELQDPSDDQCLEDVGYGYFVELLGRSFFQEVEVDQWGGVESCKMHDLMHDLAIEVAGTESATVSLNSGGNIGKDTRHVSFDSSINSPKKISSSLVQARKIRTVLLLDHKSWNNKWLTSDAVRSNFKFTRTLDLNRSGITILPKSIGSFKHLRYLDLSGNYFKMLPNSITNLVNLQTLRLNRCSCLRELPRDLKKLVNLRHLEIDRCDGLTHMPRGLSQLTNLQTLSRINGGDLKELMGLNNLKGDLRIRNLRHENDAARDYESANLKEKQYL